MLATRMRMSAGHVATITFVDEEIDTVDRTVYTFADFAIGTAVANRKVVVGIMNGDADTGRTISSVTVAGNAASAVIDQAAGNNDGRVALYQIAVPTGTTADIVVTFSGGCTRCAIATWAMYGAKSAAHDTAGEATADPLTFTLDVPAGGAAIAVMKSQVATTITWTGLTEKFDVNNPEGGAVFTYSGASDAFASEQTGLTIEADGAAALGDRKAMAAASWGPL
jgi:hypothetical protein